MYTVYLAALQYDDDIELAYETYKMALQLDPENVGAKNMIETIENSKKTADKK